ncbi:Bacteriophage protein [Erwinia rhapontici]|uniref:phage baseplate plug family protein n=1 Tax=Erwinia rhapontici TaxID=55212 RepID=UPI00105D9389|nr:hypothetical protein [Erwinia rhapontici]TDT01689.1 hypothetical protein EDF84_101416 [Erwinia rhapontici]
MNISEIPLSADNQQFAIAIAGTTYRMRLVWREFWCLDLLNNDQTPIALSLPLVTGVNLLDAYDYLNIGFSLYVEAAEESDAPTKTDLGVFSHLYVVTG